MPIPCEAHSCLIPASHRIVLHGGAEETVRLPRGHPAVLPVVTDVLSAVGLAVLEVSALTDR